MLRRLMFGLGLGAMLPALAASAADLAPEGMIDVTWTYRFAPSSMPTDNGQDFMTGEAEIILIGNAPNSLLDHASGRCMMSGPLDPKTGVSCFFGVVCAVTLMTADVKNATPTKMRPAENLMPAPLPRLCARV